MKKILLTAGIIILVILVPVGITTLSRIEKVSFTGDDYYSSSQLKDYIFYDEQSYIPLVAFWRNLTGSQAKIPFVDSYSISFSSLKEVVVNVVAKVPVGYVEFTDSFLYFDRDGMVIESSEVLYPDVPRVTGLDIDYVVLGQQLPVSSKTVLNKLLQVSQFLCAGSVIWGEEEETLIDIVQRIHFSGNQIILYIDDIQVNFGNGDELEGSLGEFKDIIPNLYGRSGTLHLEDYDSTREKPEYRFD